MGISLQVIFLLCFVVCLLQAQLIIQVRLITDAMGPVVEGEKLGLTCIATVTEIPSSTLVYTILRDNQTVSSSTGSESFSFSIPEVEKQHAGGYSCSVTGPTGLNGQSEVIQIAVEDLFQNVVLTSTYEGTLVMVNESQVLSCKATVHPLKAARINLVYAFLQAGQPPIAITGSPDIHIPRTERRFAGNHSCVAVSGTIFRYSPEIPIQLYEPFPKATLTANPLDGKAYTDDTITLKCDLDHYVGWRYYWYKDKEDSYPVHQNWGSRGDGATYSIWRASVRDSGQYWCRAGRGMPTFFTKYSDPVFINITDLFTSVNLTAHPGTVVREGHPLMLTCKAQSIKRGLPPGSANLRIRYTFWRNGISLGSFLDSGTYSISEMLGSDAGHYVCSCSTSSGRAEKYSKGIFITLDDSSLKVVITVGTVFLLLIAPVAFLIKIQWARAQKLWVSRPQGATPQSEFSMEQVQGADG